MKHEVITREGTPSKRRATNVTLPEELVAQARALGINISQTAERGIRKAVRIAADAQWKREHADWIKAHRAWVENNELPLEKYRLF